MDWNFDTLIVIVSAARYKLVDYSVLKQCIACYLVAFHKIKNKKVAVL